MSQQTILAMKKILILLCFIIIPIITSSSIVSSEKTICMFEDYKGSIEYFKQQERICSQVEREAFVKNVLRLERYGVNMKKYLYKMGQLESAHNYLAVNRLGYVGKYQFSVYVVNQLVDIGRVSSSNVPVTRDYILSSTYYQETVMAALTRHNYEVLRRYGLMSFVGKRVNGVLTTKEGLLAAAHLLGPYAVKHYFKTGGSLKPIRLRNGVLIRKKDANGTSIIDYMKEFQNT